MNWSFNQHKRLIMDGYGMRRKFREKATLLVCASHVTKMPAQLPKRYNLHYKAGCHFHAWHFKFRPHSFRIAIHAATHQLCLNLLFLYWMRWMTGSMKAEELNNWPFHFVAVTIWLWPHHHRFRSVPYCDYYH